MEWAGEFLPWFDTNWHPGQHIAAIGPTGQGKSTFTGQILRLRKYVLALDAKGGDGTLDKLGWPRITSWPPSRQVRQDIADGLPARLVVGGRARTEREYEELRELMSTVIDAAFAEGGWTLSIQELQIIADMMALKKRVERNLIAARDRASSIVAEYQAPAWVPTAASRQATWGVVWPTRDDDVIVSLAKKFGRSREVLGEALYALPDYHVLVIGLNPRMPMILTHPPAL